MVGVTGSSPVVPTTVRSPRAKGVPHSSASGGAAGDEHVDEPTLQKAVDAIPVITLDPGRKLSGG